MNTTITRHGIEFTSQITDVTKMRIGDLLVIAYSSLGHETYPDNTTMSKEIKKVSKSVEIIKNPKFQEFTALFL
jgi:hypothetical protein